MPLFLAAPVLLLALLGGSAATGLTGGRKGRGKKDKNMQRVVAKAAAAATVSPTASPPSSPPKVRGAARLGASLGGSLVLVMLSRRQPVSVHF